MRAAPQGTKPWSLERQEGGLVPVRALLLGRDPEQKALLAATAPTQPAE